MVTFQVLAVRHKVRNSGTFKKPSLGGLKVIVAGIVVSYTRIKILHYTSQTQLRIYYYVECQINDYMFRPYLIRPSSGQRSH